MITTYSKLNKPLVLFMLNEAYFDVKMSLSARLGATATARTKDSPGDLRMIPFWSSYN